MLAEHPLRHTLKPASWTVRIDSLQDDTWIGIGIIAKVFAASDSSQCDSTSYMWAGPIPPLVNNMRAGPTPPMVYIGGRNQLHPGWDGWRAADEATLTLDPAKGELRLSRTRNGQVTDP